MILVTPCGVMDTTNFGKSEVNKRTIDFSLKFQEKKEKVEAKAEKEEANKDNSDSTNTNTNKKINFWIYLLNLKYAITISLKNTINDFLIFIKLLKHQKRKN